MPQQAVFLVQCRCLYILFRLNSKLEGENYMEKEQKEMWKSWKSWEGFNDWLNLELEEEYLEKGLIPPFTGRVRTLVTLVMR